MTHREFLSWKAFHRMSPLDDERCFDAPAARVAYTVSRANGGKSEYESFLPYRNKTPAPAGKPGELGEDELAFMSYMGSRTH